MKRTWITLVLCCMGCSSDANVHRAPRPEANAAPSRALEEPHNYEPGPWWDGDMSSLFVSAAHILVTHEESRPFGFLQYARKSTRSKQAAIALAQDLRRQLAEDPARFAQLAQSSSDDRVSAEMGGELGTFRPAGVMHALVDALGHIEVGELSRVVETEVGFHILKRLPVAKDASFSYSHIVIKHEAAGGWRREDRPVANRTREEARALAEAVAVQVQREPTRFVEFVHQHSEADDVSRDGDAGEYSRYEELGVDFVVRERVRRLPVGTISGVYETSAGFEIMQRTAERFRDELAASVISLPHQEGQVARYLPARRAKARAKEVADKLLRELKASPESFAERRADYCDGFYCDGTVTWRRGRELAALELAVSRLAPGELAGTPIDTPVGFLLVRREQPGAPRAASAPIFDYRAVPPLKQAFLPQQPPNLQLLMRNVGQHALSHMSIPRLRKRQVSQLFAELDERLQSEDPVRGDFGPHLSWIDERLHALLGEDGYDDFDRCRRRYMATHPL